MIGKMGQRLGYVIAQLCLVLMTAKPTVADEVPEIVRWDRKPIAVHLPVGKERYIWFPGRVQPGVPPDLVSKLRVQAVNDTIYLQANEAFETTRLPVRDLSNGDFYLFDLTTSEDASTAPIRVFKTVGGDEDAFLGDGASDAEDPAQRGDGYLKLTRFAAQQIYAPERLTRQEPGIYSVPLRSDGPPLPRLLGVTPVETSPLASWRGRGGLYVTAISVRNESKDPVDLDPRKAVGSWLTATFHHHGLAPAGQPGDTSTLYLISDRPFMEAIASWGG